MMMYPLGIFPADAAKRRGVICQNDLDLERGREYNYEGADKEKIVKVDSICDVHRVFNNPAQKLLT